MEGERGRVSGGREGEGERGEGGWIDSMVRYTEEAIMPLPALHRRFLCLQQ